MIRTLAVALVVLILVPPALAAAHDGHDDFRSDGRSHHRTLVYRYPYASACYWQPGYWVNLVYYDAARGYVYVPQWVPAQYVCY